MLGDREKGDSKLIAMIIQLLYQRLGKVAEYCEALAEYHAVEY